MGRLPFRISGKGMLQDRNPGRKGAFELGSRATIFRWIVAATLFGVVASVDTSAALAQTSEDEGAWNKFMKTIGLKSSTEPGTDINYTERSPLVVPPSRELPPPAAAGDAPAPDWPKNSPKPKHSKSKSKGEVIPETAVQTPNPPVQKKPWYNPAGWFDKEEYAPFTGEPVRRNLTEPPEGYRIPSPEQPYGISPDKKNKTQATAANPAAANPPAATSPATPPATNPAATNPATANPAAQPGK
jgi:hypothetical protein